jgi:DNA polymerase III alpha subunit
MMLWLVDSTADCVRAPDDHPGDWFDHLPPAVPVLKAYGAERRRREEHAAMGFITDAHPMALYADELRRFRLTPSTELHRHVGRHVLVAGMLTTAKPVHTLKDEPMEFATFDDGHGLIETVLFPDIYRERGHVLFDQGPFIFRGKVEEEFGAVTLTVTHLDRLERMLAKVAGARTPAPPSGRTEPSASRWES